MPRRLPFKGTYHGAVHAGKTVRSEWGSAQKLTIHVPQLVCDSPDAEYINNELAAMYAAEYRDYESYPQAEVSQDEWCPQTYIDWDAYWYGDCVSLVVRSYYGGTDPIYSQGWCFDFAAGHKLSVTELLMRMGLDPDETQLAVYCAAIQTFDRKWCSRNITIPCGKAACFPGCAPIPCGTTGWKT